MQKSSVRPMRNPLFSPSFQNPEQLRRCGYGAQGETMTDIWRRPARRSPQKSQAGVQKQYPRRKVVEEDLDSRHGAGSGASGGTARAGVDQQSIRAQLP